MTGSHLWSFFQKQVQQHADHVALIGLDGKRHAQGTADRPYRLTWMQLDVASFNTAAHLTRIRRDPFQSTTSQGPLDDGTPATFVLHECKNELTDVLIYLACLRGGFVDVPVDDRLSNRTRDEIIARVDSRKRDVIHMDRASTMAAAHSTIDSIADSDVIPATPESTSTVLWTSGTTGVPRGVQLSNNALALNANSKLNAAPQTSQDVRLTSLSLAHAYARTCDLGTWLIRGGTLALGRGFTGWQRLGRVARPTLANVVPSLAKRLLEHDAKSLGTERLRMLGCGGAGLDQHTYESWARRGVHVILGYGLTETGPVISSGTPENSRFGCVGHPTDAWETRLDEGRLKVRGPCLMSGYLDDQDANQQKIDASGWFDTGDLIQLDPTSGQWRVLGRDDDMIVLDDGYNLHPVPMEMTVGALPDVLHVLIRRVECQLEGWLWLAPDTNDDRERSLVRALDRTQRAWPTFARRIRWKVSERPLHPDTHLTSKGTLRRAAIFAETEWNTRPLNGSIDAND
ncbi:MAG: AMP-binding protein [Planctomycetota bacterium]